MLERSRDVAGALVRGELAARDGAVHRDEGGEVVRGGEVGAPRHEGVRVVGGAPWDDAGGRTAFWGLGWRRLRGGEVEITQSFRKRIRTARQKKEGRHRIRDQGT